MSTTNTLGVVPKLLPVTATFALPLVLINTAIQARCIMARLATKSRLGDSSSRSLSDDPATGSSVAVDDQTPDQRFSDPLLIATTVHKNFIENAPFAMIFAALVELNGGDRRKLAGILGLFTLARISHAVGITGGTKMMKFRQFGFFASTFSLLGLSSWGAFLVKGYWGL